MVRVIVSVFVLACALCAQSPRGWVKGKGYGWVYGKQDEIGSLNAVTGPEWALKALREVKSGRVYDLGVRVDRRSYKWPGHAPVEVLSFRSPDGVHRGKDIPGFAAHPHQLGFHSCALFMSDNVGTQIDSLGHITKGADNHWYNGFREQDYGGDFGLMKADADTIPPIVARGVLIDVAAWKGVDALPGNFPIRSKELMAALAAQKVDVEPGDAVLIRTGTLRYWGETGADHATIARHDSAGLTLEGAKWLVEQKGAVFIGSDTSGLEVGQDPAVPGVGNPVHEYLLIDQGVHIGEFFNLEELSRNKVYRFALIAATNRLKGTTAGFALRPLAIR
ncbi:MAG: cyclase family protein [Acidobacteriota bacterium]